jgi:hypothetical protein
MLPFGGRNWQLIPLIGKIEIGRDGKLINDKLIKVIFTKLLFQNGKLTKKQVY